MRLFCDLHSLGSLAFSRSRRFTVKLREDFIQRPDITAASWVTPDADAF